MDRQDEVAPSPKECELDEGWDQHGVKVDLVPKLIVMIDQHLHALFCEEIWVSALSERFDEIPTSFTLLE